MRLLPPLALAFALAAGASAQTVEHYWDFSTMADLVGGVPTSPIGTPDLSLNATYGEAYPGSGPTLNSVISGVNNGGGYLEAAVLSGPALAMDWGLESYSFSYWTWDDLAGDGDTRGPRVFDSLNGTDVGFQLGSDPVGNWNFRNDDDLGAVNIFNTVAPFTPPADQWVHIAGVVDRGAGEVRAYVNGVLTATVPLVDQGTGQPFAGNIHPGQDLQIGVINGGTNTGQAQTCGLDDLAFYRGVLSGGDALALATGAATPLTFRTVGTSYCGPAVANSSGAAGSMSVFGSDAVLDNDVTLVADDLPNGSFGFFLTSQTQGTVNQPGGSQGVLCLGGNIGRFVGPGQIQNSGTVGRFSLAIDLTQHPTPTGLVSVAAGETWNFQGWFRDAVMGSATSNFTDGVSVTFQ